jgi:hypothetical protein
VSVDYLVCQHCGETFIECGPCVWCDCGEHWCSEECAELDGYRCYERQVDDEHDEDVEEVCSCNFCREEDFDDETLLKFALEKLKTTREELVEEYKKEQIISFGGA